MKSAADKLRLNYACTDTELSEAKSLGLRHQFRKGKKSLLMIGFLIAVTATSVVLKIQLEVPAQRRPYVYGAAALITSVVFFFNRDTRKKTAKLTSTIEIDKAGLLIQTTNTRIAIPWSGVSECLESANLFGVFLRTEQIQFVLPKRVFPDGATIDWFRQLANQHRNVSGDNTAPDLFLNLPQDQVKVCFRLGFLDHVNRTFASAIMWLVGSLTIVISIVSELRQAPDLSSAGIEIAMRSFVKALPFLAVAMVFILFALTVMTWILQRPLARQELSFNDGGITLLRPDGSATVPWSTYPYYKETRRYFLLWDKQRNWLMLPKRAFNSLSEQQRCHALLVRHLAKSRWFMG